MMGFDGDAVVMEAGRVVGVGANPAPKDAAACVPNAGVLVDAVVYEEAGVTYAALYENG